MIAKRHGVTVRQLKQWNGLRSNRIIAEDIYRVRSSDSVSRTGRRVASVPVPASGRYKIREGDSLSTIAQRFGMTVGDLKAWNNLRGSRIRAGKFLTVDPTPAGGSSARTSTRAEGSSRSTAFSAAGSASGRYKIRPGDSLIVIANRPRGDVKQLRAWNGLRNSRIRAGDYLTIGQAPASSAARSGN